VNGSKGSKDKGRLITSAIKQREDYNRDQGMERGGKFGREYSHSETQIKLKDLQGQGDFHPAATEGGRGILEERAGIFPFQWGRQLIRPWEAVH